MWRRMPDLLPDGVELRLHRPARAREPGRGLLGGARARAGADRAHRAQRRGLSGALRRARRGGSGPSQRLAAIGAAAKPRPGAMLAAAGGAAVVALEADQLPARRGCVGFGWGVHDEHVRRLPALRLWTSRTRSAPAALDTLAGILDSDGKSLGCVRKPVPGPLFAWVKRYSWIELAIFSRPHLLLAGAGIRDRDDDLRLGARARLHRALPADLGDDPAARGPLHAARGDPDSGRPARQRRRDRADRAQGLGQSRRPRRLIGRSERPTAAATRACD